MQLRKKIEKESLSQGIFCLINAQILDLNWNIFVIWFHKTELWPYFCFHVNVACRCWPKAAFIGILYLLHHSSYQVSPENITDVLISDDIVPFQPPKKTFTWWKSLSVQVSLFLLLAFFFFLWVKIQCLTPEVKRNFIQYLHLEM